MGETVLVADVPSITDWIMAVSAVLALGAAIFAGVYAKRTWETEHRRDLARDQEAFAAQASKVVALPDVGHDWQEISPMAGGFRFSAPAVRILNNSDLPVFDVRIDHPLPVHIEHVEPAELVDGRYWRGIAPPGSVVVNIHYADIEDDLVGEMLKAKARNGVAIDDSEETGAICREWVRTGRPALSFTDSAGRRWHRSRAGELSPV